MDLHLHILWIQGKYNLCGRTMVLGVINLFVTHLTHLHPEQTSEIY